MNPETFELHGLYQHGQLFQCLWQWPDQCKRMHFEDILQSTLPTTAALMPYLDACVVQCHPESTVSNWSIRTDSAEIAVTINNESLAVGHTQTLHNGDILEVGLYSFRVQVPEVAENHATNWMPDFELTDLDPMALDEQRHKGLDDLIVPDPSTATANTTAQMVRPTASKAATVDVLDMLHAQYLRKLQDPSYTGDDGPWHGLARQQENAVSTDPLQDLVSAAKASHDYVGSSLSDLLGQTQNIHDVLANLDDTVTIDLMALDKFDSVIHLFAPSQPQPTQSTNPLEAMAETSLAQLVQSSLPGLTLREHHSLSLDSAMPFFAGDSSSPQSS
ncbi:TagK domain-containing protein [Curvibacter sp. CHRR-16]|uniref:TagK domain-containing protein n=1 Tax=Curvibacter sp. CHRR-16 TaxID=2835872 RepID=UPI001BD97821|nr:TagK domain-containing protein [Curvibacter sp. CHRR-16]MBT0571847.1 TagK domain-containing protein [Curvibacter sp. CHRR-16]